MLILSFDVGCTNLAACVIEYKPLVPCFSILEWGVYDVSDAWSTINPKSRKRKLTSTDKMSCLVQKLNDLDFHNKYALDHIIIENQPVGGRRFGSVNMQQMSASLYTYYRVHIDLSNTNLVFVAARSKLTLDHTIFGTTDKIVVSDFQKKTTYQERKKRSMRMCEYILEVCQVPQHLRDHYNSHDKRDDLADSFIQAIQFGQR